jgi:hypothetical protein
MFVAVSCHQKTALSTTSVLERGDSISRATFDTLRHALMHQVSTNGLPAAVNYCNEQAMPITNYYASAGISIHRVAELCRNQNNQKQQYKFVQYFPILLPQN